MTREEIQERIKEKNNKIKRCQSRINQYQQNRTFKNNQGKFYRELTVEERTMKRQKEGERNLGRKKRTPERC